MSQESQNQYKDSDLMYLIESSFSDEEFVRFCYDLLDSVYRKLLKGTYQERLQQLITHCKKSNLTHRLLSIIKELKPHNYAKLDTPIKRQPLRLPSLNTSKVLQLKYDEKGKLTQTAQELRVSLAEMLYLAEESQPISVEVSLEVLEMINSFLEDFNKQEKLPLKKREFRLMLIRQARKLEEARQLLSESIELIFRFHKQLDIFEDTEQWLPNIVVKLADEFLAEAHGWRVNRSGEKFVDVEILGFDTVIVELEEDDFQIVEFTSFMFSEIPDATDLAKAQLSAQSLYGKVVPAVIVEMVRRQKLYNSVDFSKVLDTDKWYIYPLRGKSAIFRP